jgi:dolichol-phosphate mannosyltransferase
MPDNNMMRMKTAPDSLTIIVPTYNEKENVPLLVQRVAASLNSHPYEIVFVDDNSRDGTAQAVHELEGKYPVRVIVRTNERGLSSAVLEGLRQSKTEYALVMDADLQHPPEVIPQIIEKLKSNDLVVGSRYAPGGSPGEWTLSRKIVSFVANLMAAPLAPRIRDRMSGFFAFRTAVVQADKIDPLGWKIALEVMAQLDGKRSAEVPFTFQPRARGESKLSSKVMLQYVKQLVRLYSHKYRIVNFMFVGGIGYVVNMAAYWILTQFFKTGFDFLGQHYYLLPFVFSSLLAITSNYFLNKLWTFRDKKEQSFGALRYYAMALVTLLLDMVFLFMLVDFGKLWPVPAAAIAILIVFIVRYLLARHWVWGQH